jgi:hypothetical protein
MSGMSGMSNTAHLIHAVSVGENHAGYIRGVTVGCSMQLKRKESSTIARGGELSSKGEKKKREDQKRKDQARKDRGLKVKINQ